MTTSAPRRADKRESDAAGQVPLTFERLSLLVAIAPLLLSLTLERALPASPRNNGRTSSRLIHDRLAFDGRLEKHSIHQFDVSIRLWTVDRLQGVPRINLCGRRNCFRLDHSDDSFTENPYFTQRCSLSSVHSDISTTPTLLTRYSEQGITLALEISYTL